MLRCSLSGGFPLLVLRIFSCGKRDTNSPYIDYICIIIVDVATLSFAADSERPQSAVQRFAGSTMWKAWYEDIVSLPDDRARIEKKKSHLLGSSSATKLANRSACVSLEASNTSACSSHGCPR
jgi:hypothetical protein